MITLSNDALKGIGFSEYPDSDELEIRFIIVRVFSVEGLSFSPESSTTLTEVFDFGSNCSAVVSNSLNEACQALTGDNFVDEDESEWVEKKKARPPFALIRFQEFETRTLKGGWRKKDEESLVTYDAFPDGKADIKKWEKQSLPSIVTSLVVNMSTMDRPVNLVPVERAISGVNR